MVYSTEFGLYQALEIVLKEAEKPMTCNELYDGVLGQRPTGTGAVRDRYGLAGGIQEICAMIKYIHHQGMKYVSLYEHDKGRGRFVFKAHLPFEDLKSELASLIQVKTRLNGKAGIVYMDDGNVIDKPEGYTT